MIKQNSQLIADEGKTLEYKKNHYSSLFLGKQILYLNGEVVEADVKEEDVKEVYPVVIYTTNYYISATSYSDIVTELIRLKYSLDDELALLANLRVDPEGYADEDAQFQTWRQKCKEVAKQIVNE